MLMVIKEFEIAFEKAKQITEILAAKDKSSDFVALDDIISAVLQVSNYSEITVNRRSFSQLKLPKDMKNSIIPTHGAMLSTMTKSNLSTGKQEQVATLVINSDYSANMQRFSVVHELGHLITNIPNFTYEEIDDGRFTISAHVNADITYIPEEICVQNKYLIAEQVANIFALLVLIPRNIRIQDIMNIGIDKLTERYGVTEDAIYSITSMNEGVTREEMIKIAQSIK